LQDQVGTRLKAKLSHLRNYNARAAKLKVNPMMQRSYRDTDCAEVHDLRGLATIEVGMAVRSSVAQRLVTAYPPPKEIPPELRALLAQID
jgi:hypothetical protein